MRFGKKVPRKSGKHSRIVQPVRRLNYVSCELANHIKVICKYRRFCSQDNYRGHKPTVTGAKGPKNKKENFKM
jgi:hypothetical protein